MHQPNHWPYLGFMDKIKSSDLFVILDHLQFSDRDFHHRNRIRNKSSQGYKWLTVPLKNHPQVICDALIDNDSETKGMKWNELHRVWIDSLYRSAPYYENHKSFLDRLYDHKWNRLIDFNLAIIDYLKHTFDIKAPIILASDLNCIKEEIAATGESCEAGHSSAELSDPDRFMLKCQRSTQRFVNICKELGAHTYLSGAGGKNYLLDELLSDNGIRLEYQSFRHPVYRQCFSPFIPNLAALDCILNMDPDRIASIGYAPGADVASTSQ
jgi:hypothetical protein